MAGLTSEEGLENSGLSIRQIHSGTVYVCMYVCMGQLPACGTDSGEREGEVYRGL